MIVKGPVARLQWLIAVQNEMPRDHRALAIAVRLLEFAGNESGKCYPAIQTLADALQCEVSTIQRGLRQLKNSSFLAIETGGGRSGHRWKTNAYTLLNPSKFATVANLQPLQIDALTPADLPSYPGKSARQTRLLNSSSELIEQTAMWSKFEQVWRWSPTESKASARTIFAELSPTDQDRAIAAAAEYARACVALDQKSKHAINWLRNQGWETVGSNQKILANITPSIFVEAGTAEFVAWAEFERKHNRNLKPLPIKGKSGRMMPAAWPPEYASEHDFSDRLHGATGTAVCSGRPST